MNIRKGFFRLTLIVSIIGGIIVPLSMIEKYQYETYEVKEEFQGVSRTIKFEWYLAPRIPSRRDYESMFGRLTEAPPAEAPAPSDEREPEPTYTYTVLKIENATGWGMLFLIGSISFASIWAIYGIIALIVMGFKDKTNGAKYIMPGGKINGHKSHDTKGKT